MHYKYDSDVAGFQQRRQIATPRLSNQRRSTSDLTNAIGFRYDESEGRSITQTPHTEVFILLLQYKAEQPTVGSSMDKLTVAL
jgi:hypothetical protein